MTNEQLEEQINDLLPSIQKLACIFERKMHQPSAYSIDDLISEATWTIIGQMDSGRPKENKGAAISTYLLTAIRGRFIHLLTKSYRMNYDPKRAQTKKLDRLSRDLTLVTKYPESASSDIALTLLELLSDREQDYVQMILFPPKHIMIKINRDSKKVRGCVRETLQMDIVEEKFIRNKIKGILLETCK